ncbi:MAG: hypothetical protein E7296_10620 [Lachnospiraceae bacterium]|jgi:hypothetical protein|nr:hypothetical protein [Lachnospiraceae bacterium]
MIEIWDSYFSRIGPDWLNYHMLRLIPWIASYLVLLRYKSRIVVYIFVRTQKLLKVFFHDWVKAFVISLGYFGFVSAILALFFGLEGASTQVILYIVLRECFVAINGASISLIIALLLDKAEIGFMMMLVIRFIEGMLLKDMPGMCIVIMTCPVFAGVSYVLIYMKLEGYLGME